MVIAPHDWLLVVAGVYLLSPLVVIPFFLRRVWKEMNSVDRITELEGALRTAVLIIETAAPGAFENGNTAPGGYCDEGEVLTDRCVRDFIELLPPHMRPHA